MSWAAGEQTPPTLPLSAAAEQRGGFRLPPIHTSPAPSEVVSETQLFGFWEADVLKQQKYQAQRHWQPAPQNME